MAELTPEEREKIYLEEKARLEVRRELEGEKTSTGSVIGWIVLCVFRTFVYPLDSWYQYAAREGCRICQAHSSATTRKDLAELR